MRNCMTIYSSLSSEADTDANGLQIRQMAGSYIHAGQATLVWWSIKFHHMLTTQLCHSSPRIHKQWHVAVFIILNIPSGFITQSDSYLHMVIFHFIACFLSWADNRHPSQHVCISLAGFNWEGGGVVSPWSLKECVFGRHDLPEIPATGKAMPSYRRAPMHFSWGMAAGSEYMLSLRHLEL